MKALTLWQPWASAIAEEAKDIENRAWRSRRILERELAIHAGKTLDRSVIPELSKLWVPDDGWDALPLGAFVAVIRVKAFVRAHPSPWFIGPWGWVVGDVQRLVEPVPHRGYPGLWSVPFDAETAIRQQLEAA